MSRPDSVRERGLECPACGCRHFLTSNTEPLRSGQVRRRKSCRNCGRRVITYESIDEPTESEGRQI